MKWLWTEPIELYNRRLIIKAHSHLLEGFTRHLGPPSVVIYWPTSLRGLELNDNSLWKPSFLTLSSMHVLRPTELLLGLFFLVRFLLKRTKTSIWKEKRRKKRERRKKDEKRCTMDAAPHLSVDWASSSVI